MPDRRRIGCWLLLALLGLAAFVAWREYQRLVREEPERFPWTPLSLSDPVGPYTGRKLAALGNDPQRCEALLTAAESGDRSVPALRGVRRRPAAMIRRSNCVPATPPRSASPPPGWSPPAPLPRRCVMWERDVVQPAAQRHLGERVARVDHFGSYSCRRLYGRSEGAYSEHATANAVDIAGFRLASGRRISVLGDWSGDGDEAAFLRAVRDGACDLFATVLSPDYNAAHADHLHFDQAMRGAMGWRGCR